MFYILEPRHGISTSRSGFIFYIFEPRHGISNNVVCATNKASDQPAHNAQSDQSLC